MLQTKSKGYIAPLVAPPWIGGQNNVRMSRLNHSNRIVAIDERFEEGYERMRRWANSKNEPDSYVWARGNLDQLVLDSMEEQLTIEPIFPFKRWRDVRTAVDFLTGTTNGYCKVDYPGFDPYLHITKHNPIDDCVLDVMQLIYGVKEL